MEMEEKMEVNYGILSLLPAVIVIILALKTKKTVFPLLIGAYVGVVILSQWNILIAVPTLVTSYIVPKLTSAWNIKTLLICSAAGGYIRMLRITGAGEAFANAATKSIKTKKGAQLATCGAALGFIYTEPNFVLGVVMRPITEKLKVSRVKLAYLTDSLGCNIAAMSPICSYGPYIVGLIAAQLVSIGMQNVDPWTVYIKYIPNNFYGILAVLMVLYVVISSKDIGSMYAAEKRADQTGRLIGPDDQPIVAESKSDEFKDFDKISLATFVLPFSVLFITLFSVIFYTGEIAVNGFFQSFLHADISLGIICAMSLGAFTSIVVGVKQKLFSLTNGFDQWVNGIVAIMQVNMVIIFAWALGGIIQDLGVKAFISGTVASIGLAPQLLPALIFIAGAVLSFATGSSWGTFALLMPIAVPVCHEFGIPIEIAIAASVGGGLFGDHCSPISDNTIKASLASGSDHLEHVKTQIPYALVLGSASVIGFTISAYTFSVLLGLAVASIYCFIAVNVLNKRARAKYDEIDYKLEKANKYYEEYDESYEEPQVI